MARDAKTKPSLKLPPVRPGGWRGEILGGCTVNFGQVVQPGPPRQSVEFTYVIMSAVFTMPDVRFTWPGMIMIMTPTPMKTEFPDAGHLFKGRAPSLSPPLASGHAWAVFRHARDAGGETPKGSSFHRRGRSQRLLASV